MKGKSIVPSLIHAYLHISNLISGPVLSGGDPGGCCLSQNLLKEAASFVGVFLLNLGEKDQRKIPAIIKGKIDDIMPLNI